MVEKTQQLLAGQGYVEPLEQFEYWFGESLNILLLYDKDSADHARALYEQMLSWGLFVLLQPAAAPDLYKTVTENDIAIIHNLATGGKIRLFLLSQFASDYLHNPPLVVHGQTKFENKSALIEFYRLAFARKLI